MTDIPDHGGITTPPTLVGQQLGTNPIFYTEAWQIDIPAALARAKLDPANDATVASWIVFAPWAHPAWHSYWINCCHLRPMPDNRETKIYLRGATHEIWVMALDPESDLNRLLETGRPRCLLPANFAAQFIESSDRIAAERIRMTVNMILRGDLSPDTDFRSHWYKLYGDNMRRA